MPPIVEHAPAKINLTLEVLGRRPDGYHELRSLVAFAAIGDTLELHPDAPPGLDVTGPMADRLAGPNLVMTALEAVRAAWPDARLGRFRLTKRLPVAAGIGGGSADAAAALRALRRLNDGRSGAPTWDALALRLGADVPVCLAGRFCEMSGAGERVTPLPPIGPLHAVLVNPGVPLATSQVFAELAAPPLGTAPVAPGNTRDIGARIARGRNDLQPAAMRLAPIVTEIIAALAATSGAYAVRLSGSGPTCFALYPDAAHAAAAAGQVAQASNDWWIAPTTLA